MITSSSLFSPLLCLGVIAIIIIINVFVIAGCFLSPTCWLTGLMVSPLFSPTLLEFWSRFNQEEEGGKTWPSLPCRSSSAPAQYFSFILLSVCRLRCAMAGSGTSVAFPCFSDFGFSCVFLDLSFSQNCLCLLLPVCLSILFPEPFPPSSIAYCITVPALSDAPALWPCKLYTVSLLPHIFVYIHTQMSVNPKEKQRSLSCLKEGEEKQSIRSCDQGVPMSERESSEQERQETHVAMTQLHCHHRRHHQCLPPGHLPPPLGGQMCHPTHAHYLLSPTPHTNGRSKTCSFIQPTHQCLLTPPAAMTLHFQLKA